jgi:uncharacterized protein YheU (UPF0270 family)
MLMKAVAPIPSSTDWSLIVTKYVEVTVEMDQESQPNRQPEFLENGVEIPFERINPETLRNLIAEFVTREWEEVGDAHHTLDDKIGQVVRQLKEKRAKVVFDLSSETCNIVTCEKR